MSRTLNKLSLMSRTVKGLRFLPYLQADKLVAMVLWMLGEDMRFLDQRQRIFLFMAQQTAWASAYLCHIPLPLKSHGVMQISPDGCLHKRWPALQANNSKLRKIDLFYCVVKQAFPLLWRQTFPLFFQGSLLRKDSGKESME